MRSLLLCLGLILGFILGVLPSLTLAEEKRDLKAIDKVFREPVILSSPESPAMHVAFRHTDHKGMRCAVCHHKVTPADERYTSCGADAACHSISGRSVEAKSLFMAYHDRDSERSCYGCHFKEKARFNAVKGCTTCHENLEGAPAGS